MENYKNNLYVLAVASNQNNADSLLKSCFPDIQTSDSQEYTTKVGDFNLFAYTKFPGKDVLRRSCDFLDVLLCAVDVGDKVEHEILNYAFCRKDARYRFLVGDPSRDTGLENIVAINSESVLGKVTEYSDELKSKFTGQLNVQEYATERRLFACNAEDNFPRLNKLLSVEDRAFEKVLNRIEIILNDNLDMDLNNGFSKNVGKSDISPENKISSGIGAQLEILFGEEFDKNNENLPLTVRDNVFTASLELNAKSEKEADEVIKTLENVKNMVDGMGLLKELEKKTGSSITFSKDGVLVWIDFTFGGVMGERILNKIKSLNMDKFKVSIKDLVKLQTDLNCNEIWNEPNLENIISKLATLTLVTDGELLNIRNILHLIRGMTKFTSKDDKKKTITLVSYGALMLSCFENANMEIKYNSDELKQQAMEAADGFLGGEGASKGMIEGADDTFNKSLLPMALQMIEQVKPMIQSFGEGFKSVNFDKICLEILLPTVKLEVKATFMLPGLTDFMEKNVLN